MCGHFSYGISSLVTFPLQAFCLMTCPLQAFSLMTFHVQKFYHNTYCQETSNLQPFGLSLKTNLPKNTFKHSHIQIRTYTTLRRCNVCRRNVSRPNVS